MGLARSTYYDEPELQPISEARLVEQIKAVCAEWPAYGYRRVTAELHDEGRIVNHKKVMRLMKENGLRTAPAAPALIATTDSNHDGPIFPNVAENLVPTRLNQLWVADITYIAIATGFVYLAAILDAWSRRVVGYAIGKRIDARLALTALRATIAARRPPAGCVHGLRPDTFTQLSSCLVQEPCTDGADHTFFAATSFITSISRSRSATSFFSRAFSASSCFRRLTSFAWKPPKRLRQV